MNRPGIKNETLGAAGITPVDAAQSEKLTGLAASGLYIPYRTIDGHLVVDKEQAYGRLRLAQPCGDQKYHQRAGSTVHAYIPPGLRALLAPSNRGESKGPQCSNPDLFVIEGEFKALSLVEAGYPAVGISGFWGFAQGGSAQLAPELLEVITRYRPGRIFYVGDSDTALNADFSKAASVFLDLVMWRLDGQPSIPHPLSCLHLPRIPLDAPGKGVDDVRAKKGADFNSWWLQRIEASIEFDTKTRPGQLAVMLLEPEQEALKRFTGGVRARAESKLVKMAAAFCKEPLVQETIADIALKVFGVKALAFRRALAVDVAANKASLAAESGASKRRLVLPNVEPWPEPVEGADVLNEIRDLFTNYVVLPKYAAEALALWTLHTYAFKQRSITAYLGIVSPEKRCGKTTVLRLLTMLVNRPLAASNVSTASLFRVVQETEPTLLIDEADTFLEKNDELRGILNSGHCRDTAFVVRVEGDDHSLVKFSCWCPKAIAAIGGLPGTLADRCIIITMRRKAKGEQRPRLRDLMTEAVKRKCARFIKDHEEEIKNAQPRLPPELNDRGADIWEPLLALADLAGGHWPATARLAAVALSGAAMEESIGTLLLADIRDLFEGRNADRMFTRQIVEALIGLTERPWSELRRGKPISENWLAKQLRTFGVSSRSVRIGTDTGKGYYMDDLADAFERYVGPGGNVTLQNGTDSTCDVSENPIPPSNDASCDAVTDKKAIPGSEQETFL